MNQLLEQVISSFLPQGNAWKLNTSKGYWFIATVDNNSYDPENNFDDLGQEERIIKYKFNINVKAYIFASQNPGNGIPIKRYVSSPIINFNIELPDQETESNKVIDPFIGSDDPTLPLDYQKNLRSDQRESGIGNYDPKDPSLSTDPAYASRANKQNISQYRKIVLKTIDGKNAVNYIRVYNVNKSSGESIVKPNSNNSSSTSLNAEALLGGLTYHTTKDF